MQQNKFSDQLCAEDILVSQKFLSGNYNTAIQEAANTDLRRDFTEINRQEQDAAQKIFQVMNQKGWYQVAPAEPQKINEARSKAQQQLNDQSSNSGLLGSPGMRI